MSSEVNGITHQAWEKRAFGRVVEIGMSMTSYRMDGSNPSRAAEANQLAE